MESQLHLLLMTLLIEVLELFWADRDDYFVGGNMFLYFSALQEKKNDFRGPDFFVVLDTEHRPRASWVAWEEGGRLPNFILEITSPSTEAQDRGAKKQLYERALRVPEYFIYDPRTGVLEGYRLGPQRTYEPIAADAAGRIPSQQLGLLLGVREGVYLRTQGPWLRWSTPDGQLIPTPQERSAEAERRLCEYERRFGPL